MARRRDIRYSSWKLTAVANLIGGKHIYDAQGILGRVDKKGGNIVATALENAQRAGTAAGYAEERMFVKTITVGKGLSHKKLDIKARGKMGVIRVPKSNLRLTLEEKSPGDFYKMLLKGEATPGLGHFFRRLLYNNDAGFEHVKALSHLTTSNGRYYRRTQFKRLVAMVQKEYQKRGLVMREDKIERNLLEKVTADFVGLLERHREQSSLQQQASRQAHFEKNYRKH